MSPSEHSGSFGGQITGCHNSMSCICIKWHFPRSGSDLSGQTMQHLVGCSTVLLVLNVDSHLKWRLMLTKRPASCHTSAICSPVYRRGPPATWLDPPHPLESKLSSDLPAWNDPFRFIPHNRPASSLVHIPTLWVYVLSHMPVISPFHICASFFPLCWKKVGKVEEKKGAQWKFQTLLQCCMHGSSDTLLSSRFPPPLTDGSYQTVWKYCG